MSPGVAVTSDNAVRIPKRIGRYRIVRPLSKGGMALVYEARRESIGGVSTPVAIKVILPDFANSETFKNLFINEARLGAAMRHQNLVQIQDFAREDDMFFLVMEYVEGHTLSRGIGVAARSQRPIPMGVICEIGRQACEGLHYAHEARDSDGRHLNLIHRDIKPSNLILDSSGTVKILDFGISKGSLVREQAGQVKGTWGYMSPEQAIGRHVSRTSDIYSLAIVLYEMASRRSLFKKMKQEEIRKRLLEGYPARMLEGLDPMYAPLVKVLRRALARHPSDRFATARDFGQALAALLPDPISAGRQTRQFHKFVDEQRLHLKHQVGSGPSSIRSKGKGAAKAAPLESTRSRRRGASRWGARAALGMMVASFLVLGFVVWDSFGREDDPEAIAEVHPLQAPEVEPLAPAAQAAPPEVPAAPPVVEAAAAAEPAPEAAQVAEAVPVVAPVEPTRPVVQAVPSRPAPVKSAEPVQAEALQPAPVAEPEPVAASPEAWLVVYSVQPGEVYLDGKLLRPPLSKGTQVTPGRHVVSIVEDEGRRYSFPVQVDAGYKVTRIYDFERNTWKSKTKKKLGTSQGAP